MKISRPKEAQAKALKRLALSRPKEAQAKALKRLALCIRLANDGKVYALSASDLMSQDDDKLDDLEVEAFDEDQFLRQLSQLIKIIKPEHFICALETLLSSAADPESNEILWRPELPSAPDLPTNPPYIA